MILSQLAETTICSFPWQGGVVTSFLFWLILLLLLFLEYILFFKMLFKSPAMRYKVESISVETGSLVKDVCVCFIPRALPILTARHQVFATSNSCSAEGDVLGHCGPPLPHKTHRLYNLVMYGGKLLHHLSANAKFPGMNKHTDECCSLSI